MNEPAIVCVSYSVDCRDNISTHVEIKLTEIHYVKVLLKVHQKYVSVLLRWPTTCDAHVNVNFCGKIDWNSRNWVVLYIFKAVLNEIKM